MDMLKLRKIHSLRALLNRARPKGGLPVGQCGTRLALGCALVLLGAMICGALVYRALGL
jgi:hypothetical protein